MDSFILVSYDRLYRLRLIGVWSTYQEAKDAMDGYYRQALDESGLVEAEQEYACALYDSEAIVCPPHGDCYVEFRIFDGFNDAEINKSVPLRFCF